MSALFGTFGVTLAFLPRWLEVERGLTGVEIGAVLSLAQLTRVATGPAIAFWADGAADRRTPMRIVALCAWAAFASLFFVAHGFWQMLAFGFVAWSLSQAMTPLVEAATLRATAYGQFNYGIARGIGSISFIIGNVAGGALVQRFGIDVVVVWVLGGLACVVCAAWLALKPDPQPAHAVLRTGAARVQALTNLLRSRRFLILISACGLIQCGHAFFYTFSTLVWRGQGIGADTVGLLWALGVAVEVAFLWSLAPIEQRIRPEWLILIGAGGGIARWLLSGFSPTGIELWFLQALHALSFASVHVGAMRLIYRETPDTSAAMAQTLYAALSAGLLMGLSTLASGFLYEHFGVRGYWAMAGLAAAGGALALLLLRPSSAPAR